MEKQNLTQQKHAFTNQKKCTTTQNKLKPGLVASYDIWPGNEQGLFLQKYYYFNTTNIFYLDVSVSIKDLHQKKFLQFLFRFLGLFLFQCFINLSLLTYLLRHLPTYLQPRDPHGAQASHSSLHYTRSMQYLASCVSYVHNYSVL